MKVSSVISELKTSLNPYLIFWDEWVVNENCNLTQEEISTVNFYIQNKFEINLFDKLFFQDKAEKLIKISVKLNIAQRVYKEWVVVKFLFTIVEMAKAYGYDTFLNTPINQLGISEEVKIKLESFKVYTLQQLFIIYKSEDFARAWLYNNIIDFLVMYKEQQKPVSVKSH